MIIWRGLGIWLLAIVGAALVATSMAFDAILQDAFYFGEHRWTMGVAFLVSALACYPFGQFTRKRQGVVEDGELALDFGHHSLFFIPVHIWVYLLALAGAVLCVMEFLG
jgi:hypothetical protein